MRSTNKLRIGVANIEELQAKIRAKGYWLITIRPTQFENARIETLGDSWDAVASSSVSLRGWDYPHVDTKSREIGDDWVQGSIDWEDYGHLEVWRLWQSGQFRHQMACLEDYHKITHRAPAPEGPYLLWLSSLYTITEIFEFASRLAARKIMVPGASIQIELQNMVGRKLTYWGFDDHIRDNYVAELETISYEATYSTQELIGRSAEAAVKAATYVYERFGWLNPPQRMIEDRQKGFLERRLRV